MKHHHLQAFLAVAGAGSLAKASASVNKTAAAVSKSILELEDALGVPLFDRTPRGMSLTEGGRVLLPRAQAMVAEWQRAGEDLQALKGGRQGRLRIGLTTVVSALIAPTVIEHCMAQWPAVRIELYEYQREAIRRRLDDGTIDLMLYSLPSFADSDADAEDEALYTTDFAFAVRRDGALARTRSLAELCGALWIDTDPSGKYKAFIDSIFRDAGLDPPSKSLMCAASVLGVAIALQMDAVVIISKPAAEAIRGLVVLPLLPNPPTLCVYSRVRHTAKSSPLVETFLATARDVMQRPFAAPPVMLAKTTDLARMTPGRAG